MIKKANYSVFRNVEFGDCSNCGLSSQVTSGWMFYDGTREEAFQYCAENGLNPNFQFFLCERMLWGEDHSFAEPLVLQEGAQTFGGNFLYTSNGSSFHFKNEQTTRPIPIHDRFESWTDYAAMGI